MEKYAQGGDYMKIFYSIEGMQQVAEQLLDHRTNFEIIIAEESAEVERDRRLLSIAMITRVASNM